MKLFKRWNFVPCITATHARVELSGHIARNEGGSEFKLCVIGHTWGYKWR